MNKHGNSKWKKVMTFLCVAAPILAMVIFMLNSSGIINIGSILPFTLLLLCPLSHLLMMPLMHKALSKENSDNNNNNDNKPSCH